MIIPLSCQALCVTRVVTALIKTVSFSLIMYRCISFGRALAECRCYESNATWLSPWSLCTDGHNYHIILPLDLSPISGLAKCQNPTMQHTACKKRKQGRLHHQLSAFPYMLPVMHLLQFTPVRNARMRCYNLQDASRNELNQAASVLLWG